MDKQSKRKTKSPTKRRSKTVDKSPSVTHAQTTDISADMLKYNSKILFETNSAVLINLKQGQSVFCNAGSMAWMDSKILVKTHNRSGFFAGLKRKILTDNTFFTTDYTGTSPEGNEIVFAPKLPGSVVLIEIKPGDGLYVSGDGFLVAGNNVETAVKTRFRNMFLNEDTFMTKLKVDEKSSSNGSVWVSSYGNIYKKIIPIGESCKVDNGYFLACDAGVNYTIGKVGGLKSFAFGGEGIVMNFTAKDKPITLYLQTRSFKDLVKMIAQNTPKQSSYGQINFSPDLQF